MDWARLILAAAALVRLGVAGEEGHHHYHHLNQHDDHQHHSEHHLQPQEVKGRHHHHHSDVTVRDVNDVVFGDVAPGARRQQRDARGLITATAAGEGPGGNSPPVGLIQPWSSEPALPLSSAAAFDHHHPHHPGSSSLPPHHHHRRRLQHHRHRRYHHRGDDQLPASPSSSPSVPPARQSRSHALEETRPPVTSHGHQHHREYRQHYQRKLHSPSTAGISSSSLSPVTGGRLSYGTAGHSGTLTETDGKLAGYSLSNNNNNKINNYNNKNKNNNNNHLEKPSHQQLISRRALISSSRRTQEELQTPSGLPATGGAEGAATHSPGGAGAGGEVYSYPQQPLEQRAEGGGGGGDVVGQVGGTVTADHLEYGFYNRSMSPTQGLSPEEIKAQEDCERKMRNTPYPTDGGLYCNRTFDGWGCFNDTPAGTRTYTPCPAFTKGFDPRLFGYKDCNHDGTWWQHPITNKSWTNYTTCVNTEDLKADTRTLYIFFAGYTISIVALLASLFIFFYFRQLQCDRVTIHRNLFASYILNGVSWILYYSLAAMSGDTMMENPVWCQALHVVTQYLVACNFFWMFCEGLYLHTIIVSAFTSGKKLIIACYLIGWCSPIVTTVIYTALRAHHPNRNGRCWLDETPLQYIVVGPIVLTIALNLAFLCNIVRVLITKLRAVNSPDTNQTRKAVRATLILIPLLGLQYILFPFRPDKGTPLHEVYSYVSAFVTSFQGLFVALIFCFCNGEVMSVLKRKWGQHRLMHGNANGRTAIYTQTTVTMAENTQLQVQPPKSPRLYDNRSQAPGGKPAKSASKAFKLRLGRGRSLDPPDYDDVVQEDQLHSHELVKKCTSAV